MSDPCKSLMSTDPQAAGLCHLLIDEMGVPLEKIDQGAPYIHCTKSKCQMQIVEGTAGNGNPEAGEVRQESIALMEKEEDAFVASSGQAKRSFTNLVAQKTTFRVPWLFNDFDTSTDNDDRLLLKIAGKISEIKLKIAKEGKTSAFNRELLGRLITWMEKPAGVGIVRMQIAEIEPTLVEFFNQPEGDCSELSRYGYAVFRLAGLKPMFIDVQRNDYDPGVYSHNVVGVHLDPSNPDRITTVDLYYGVILEKGHLMQSEMPAVSALAAYCSNLATLLMTDKYTNRERDTERIEKLFLEALRYDPYYAVVHHNYAYFLDSWKGDRERARAEAKKACQLRPDHPRFQNLLWLLNRG